MLKRVLWSLFVAIMILSARSGADAQQNDIIKAATLEALNTFLEDNNRFSSLGDTNRGMLLRIDREEIDAILATALKSKDSIKIEKAFIAALHIDSPSFAKQAKKQLKSKSKAIRRAAQLYVFIYGDSKDRGKAVATYFQDGPGMSWFSCSANHFSLGREFAKACFNELKRNNKLSKEQRTTIVAWLNAQLGTHELKDTDLKKQFSLLSKASAERLKLHNKQYEDLKQYTKVWDLNGMGTLTFQTVVLSSDGDYVFVVHQPETSPSVQYRCYAADTGELVFNTPRFTSIFTDVWMAYDNSKKHLVVTTAGAIKTFAVPSGEEVASYPVARDKNSDRVAILPTGKAAIVKVGDRLFLQVIGDDSKPREIWKFPGVSPKMPENMIGSGDGKLLAFRNGREKGSPVRIINLETGKELWSLKYGYNGISFTNSGEFHVEYKMGDLVYQHWLFDAKTGKRIRRIDGVDRGTASSGVGTKKFYVTHQKNSNIFVGAYDTGMQVGTVSMPLVPRNRFDPVRNAWVSDDGNTVVSASRPMAGSRSGDSYRLTVFRRK